MKTTLKTLTFGMILTLGMAQSLSASDKNNKITIAEMEINLATLANEISEEKVKLYQKEALLHQMKLALLKEKKAKR
jgi:hypothetical protein